MRTLKPGFFTNEDLCELAPLARLLFAGLWCWADREGRLQDRPKKFQAEILPYNRVKVGDFLDRLAARGFIVRYQVGGERYIQIVNWSKHQNPHVKEPPSTIPAPGEHGASTGPTPGESGARNPPSPAGHESWDPGHKSQAMGCGEQATEGSIPSEPVPQEETARAPATAIERARGHAAPKPGQTPDALASRQLLEGWLTAEFHRGSAPNAAERDRIEQAAGLLYESRVDVDEAARLVEAARERWSEDAEITPLAIARNVATLRSGRPAARRNGKHPPIESPMEQSRRIAMSVLAEQAPQTPARRALA